jgi:DNA-binding MarR family transcriptional regulator
MGISPTPEQCLEMGQNCAFHNLRRASRAVTQVFDAYFDEIGLKATQFTVLAVLAHAGESAPTVTALAESLVLEQSSLSRNLAVLERLGHVKLSPGTADRRERIVTLTRAGRTMLAKGYPVWKRAQAAIAQELDGDLEGQLKVLRKMTRSAKALRPAKPARTSDRASKNTRKNSGSARA